MVRFSIVCLSSFFLTFFLFGCRPKGDFAFLPPPYRNLKMGDSLAQVEQKLSKQLVIRSYCKEREYGEFSPDENLHIAGYEWSPNLLFHNNLLVGVHIHTYIILDDCDDFIKHILHQLGIARKDIASAKIRKEDIVCNYLHTVYHYAGVQSHGKTYGLLLTYNPRNKKESAIVSFGINTVDVQTFQAVFKNSFKQEFADPLFDSIEELDQTYPKK